MEIELRYGAWKTFLTLGYTYLTTAKHISVPNFYGEWDMQFFEWDMI